MFKKFLLCVGCLFTINICVATAEAQLPLLLRVLGGRTVTGAVTRGVVRRGITRTPSRRTTPNSVRYLRSLPNLSGYDNPRYRQREYRTSSQRVFPVRRQNYRRSRNYYAPRYVPRNVSRYIPRRVYRVSCW